MGLGQEIVSLEKQLIVQTYRRAGFVVERGEGVYLYDSDGRRYLDFVAGIAVNALGYGDPELLQAIDKQARRLIHVSNLYHTEPHVRLAQMLVQNSFADRVFFCNSGAEATEAAIKFARKWGRAGGQDRYEVVCFTGAFHGRTMGALALTPREHYQAPFRPLIGGVRVAQYNDLRSAEQAIGESTCAVIVEPVQGEGGVHLASAEFMAGLRELCTERNVLLICDEVQCGLGRTGRLWAHQLYGVEPDIMTLAKPLGGGLPMAAVLVREEVACCVEPGDHGSTFGANPVAAAAAQVVFRRVAQDAFLARVREVGSYLGRKLHELAERKREVRQVRGVGLIWGIELTKEAAPVVEQGYAEGVIMAVAGPNVLRLVPPLIIEPQHVDQVVQALERILA
jgi:acetylornithine/N-succinyldiaminopimelate aminotransferase